MGEGAEPETGAGTGADTGARARARAGTGAGTGAETGTETGARAETETGADSRADWPAVPPVRLRLQDTDFTLEGASVAGTETWLRIPEWHLGFDLGRCDAGVLGCHTLCLTHAHMDHAGALGQYLSLRAMARSPKSTVLAPAEACADLQAIITLWEKLTRCSFEWQLVPMRPGDIWSLGRGRSVQAFATTHVVPSLGYAVLQDHRQLRPELRDLPLADLQALRRSGQDPNHTTQRLRLAISGDTTIEGIRDSEALHMAEVALCEATFVDERRTVEQARSKGHTHLQELLPVARDFAGRWLVPYHISRIYGTRMARSAIARQVPEEMANKVAVFLP